MKYHKILGIEENATEQEIIAAYEKKQDMLCNNIELLSDDSISKKTDELLTAKAECMKWLMSTSSQRRSMRMKESRNTLMNPNILYSQPIGFCSACCYSCHGCCGDGIVDCGNIVDGGCYLMIGLAIISGIIQIASWGKETGTRNEIRQLEIENQRLQDSIARLRAENQNMPESLRIANDKLKEARTVVSDEEKQYKRIVSFCQFFEILGCDSYEVIKERQWSSVKKARKKEDQMKNKALGISNIIQSNEEEIKRINNIIQSNNARISSLKSSLNH